MSETNYVLRSNFAQGRFIGNGNYAPVTGVQEPLEFVNGVLSIRRASADQNGYLDCFGQVLGETKVVAGLVISPCGTAPQFANQGLAIFLEGDGNSAQNSYATLRWDDPSQSFMIATHANGLPDRAVRIGDSVEVLGGTLSLTGPISMCGSPAFPLVLPIASVSGDLTYTPATGDLSYTHAIDVPALTANHVPFGDALNSMTSSAQYQVDNGNANASIYKVTSPNGLKLTQLVTDQNLDISQVYSTAATMEIWGNSAKCATLTNSVNTSLFPLTVTSTTNPQLTVQNGVATLTLGTTNAGNATISASGTSISTANELRVTNTTDASSVSSGSIITSGGIGCTKQVFAGNLRGESTNFPQIVAAYPSGQSLGISVNNVGETYLSVANNGALHFGANGTVYVDNASGASSVTSGALRVKGGISSENAVYAPGLYALSTATGGAVYSLYNVTNFSTLTTDLTGVGTLASSGAILNIGSTGNQVVVRNTGAYTSALTAGLYAAGGAWLDGGLQCAALKVGTGAAITTIDNDGTMAANSATRGVTQASVVSYVAGQIPATINLGAKRIGYGATPSGGITASASFTADNVSTTGTSVMGCNNNATFTNLVANDSGSESRIDATATTFIERLNGFDKLSHTSTATNINNQMTITNAAGPQFSVGNGVQTFTATVSNAGTTFGQSVAGPISTDTGITGLLIQSTAVVAPAGTGGAIQCAGGLAVQGSIFVNEDLYQPWKSITLTGSGPFNDIVIGEGNLYEITSTFATNAQLTGIANGEDGRVIKIVVNRFGQSSLVLRVIDNSTFSTAANRILCPGGGSINVSASSIGAFTLAYRAGTINRWITVSVAL